MIETEDGRLAILNVCTNLSAFIEERDKLVQQIEQVYCEKIQKQQEYENALRPLRLSDFNGQKKVVDNLEVFVEAAKYRHFADNLNICIFVV